MTSREYEKLAEETLRKIHEFSFEEANTFSAIAQAYATLAVAAAQREYNEMKIGAFVDERIPKG